MFVARLVPSSLYSPCLITKLVIALFHRPHLQLYNILCYNLDAKKTSKRLKQGLIEDLVLVEVNVPFVEDFEKLLPLKDYFKY